MAVVVSKNSKRLETGTISFAMRTSGSSTNPPAGSSAACVYRLLGFQSTHSSMPTSYAAWIWARTSGAS